MTQAGRLAHQQLGLELRLVIRRRQLLTDVEIVLGVLTAEFPGHRDRRHVMQRRVEPAREFDHGAGAFDVGDALIGFGGGDVVDRRAVHYMLDVAQLGDGLVGQPEIGLGQVADQWFRSFAPLTRPGVRTGPTTGDEPLPTPRRPAGSPADATPRAAR